MDQIVIYLSMVQKITTLKQKILKIVSNPLCFGNISKDFSVANMKKTGLYGYAYDFGVDYRAITVDEIINIHKCLMEKNNVK